MKRIYYVYATLILAFIGGFFDTYALFYRGGKYFFLQTGNLINIGIDLINKNYEGFPQLNLKDSVDEIRDLIKFDNFNMITKIDKPLINIAQNGVLTSLEGNIIIKDGLHFSLVGMKEDLINKYIDVFFLPNGFIFTLKFEGSGHVYIEIIGENISLGGSERGFKFENPSQISNLFIDGQSRDVNNNPGVGFYGFECRKIEFDFVS